MVVEVKSTRVASTVSLGHGLAVSTTQWLEGMVAPSWRGESVG